MAEYRNLLNLDDNNKIVKDDWVEDEYQCKDNINYIIKDIEGNTIWKPNREGDFDFNTPFPKGYIPTIGSKIVLSNDMNARDVFDVAFTKVYKILDVIIATTYYNAICIIEVELIRKFTW
jgi:hypothetical protein